MIGEYVSAGSAAGETLARGSGLSVGEGLFLTLCTVSSMSLVFMSLSLPKFILRM